MYINKILIMCLSLLLFSCDNSAKVSDQINQMKDVQTQILLQQDKILKGLSSLDKKLAGINTAANTNKKQDNNKRKTPNPNFVHNIDIGESVVLGNPDAKVTVTKFTDFQ